MHQDPLRFSQTCPKIDRPLEQAFVSNKNDKKTLKNTFLALVGPHFSFCVFHTDYAKNHPPKSNCRQVDQNSSKAFNIALV